MGQHVLLIEDEPHIAEAIGYILGRDGWEVTTLSQGRTAEDTVRTLRPDLVILDLMLPDRSGLEILSALRADPANAGLPVMMLTAKGQSRDREAAERAGANLFMAKPFSNAEILANVRALVRAA
jgi:DNA-binding response OmpR family regulator